MAEGPRNEGHIMAFQHRDNENTRSMRIIRW